MPKIKTEPNFYVADNKGYLMDQLIIQSDCEIPTAPKGVKAPSNQCLTDFFPFALKRPTHLNSVDFNVNKEKVQGN